MTGSDDSCTPYGSTATGGIGGGIIHIYANDRVEIDGTVVSNGEDSTGGRGGGGSGGSVYIETENFLGLGDINTNGGSASGETNCRGGGGAGGRAAITQRSNTFTGTVTSFGGTGHECGGAGTILYRDRQDDDSLLNRLIVDNDATRECEALEARIEYAELTDINRGSDSYRTYIHDVDDVEQHSFSEV